MGRALTVSPRTWWHICPGRVLVGKQCQVPVAVSPEVVCPGACLPTSLPTWGVKAARLASWSEAFISLWDWWSEDVEFSSLFQPVSSTFRCTLREERSLLPPY